MKTLGILKRLSFLFIVLVMAMPVAASARESQTVQSREALTQMLAPVALYPDVLLSQVLMASTYPLEIVEADRWIKENPTLTGDNLDEYLKDKDWDASVKAICHEPKLLSLMSEKLDETTRIGNAFLIQKDDVMDVIQKLRSRAYNDGNLYSNDKQKVVVESSGNIVIEPVDTQVVYVPYYNTRYVYGDWWYPAWPPWYWGPDELVTGTGIYFWPNAYIGFGLWSYFDWPDRTIIIHYHHRPHYFHRDYNWRAYSGRWHHNPHHDRGIRYDHRSAADRSQSYVVVNHRNVEGNTRSSVPSGETRYLNQSGHRGIINHRKAETSAKGYRSRNWTIANHPVDRRNGWNRRAEEPKSDRDTKFKRSETTGPLQEWKLVMRSIKWITVPALSGGRIGAGTGKVFLHPVSIAGHMAADRPVPGEGNRRLIFSDSLTKLPLCELSSLNIFLLSSSGLPC